jgi:hypothetical protein
MGVDSGPSPAPPAVGAEGTMTYRAMTSKATGSLESDVRFQGRSPSQRLCTSAPGRTAGHALPCFSAAELPSLVNVRKGRVLPVCPVAGGARPLWTALARQDPPDLVPPWPSFPLLA